MKFIDGLQMRSKYKNVCTVNKHVWLSQRNPVLTTFLSASTGVTTEELNIKMLNPLTASVERVIYIKNLLIITLFAFMLAVT